MHKWRFEWENHVEMASIAMFDLTEGTTWGPGTRVPQVPHAATNATPRHRG